MKTTLRIWVVTDDRAGNRAQARALAAAIARRRPVEVADKVIAVSRWAAILPARIIHSCRLGMLGVAEGALDPPWPDLVIGAGRRSAPVVAELGRRGRVATVQILDPQMPLSAFSHVIAPQHDGLMAGNVLPVLGALSVVTGAEVAEAGAAARAGWAGEIALTPPLLAVLIGGPSRSSGFDQGRVVEALVQAARTHGLLVTLSRRSPDGLAARLREALGPRAWIWDGTGANPYPALLDLADAVLVTADSVNMASEAASTGKPVHILQAPHQSEKFRHFHDSLARHGASRAWQGRVEMWRYPPFDEADRAAAELARLWAGTPLGEAAD